MFTLLFLNITYHFHFSIFRFYEGEGQENSTDSDRSSSKDSRTSIHPILRDRQKFQEDKGIVRETEGSTSSKEQNCTFINASNPDFENKKNHAINKFSNFKDSVEISKQKRGDRFYVKKVEKGILPPKTFPCQEKIATVAKENPLVAKEILLVAKAPSETATMTTAPMIPSQGAVNRLHERLQLQDLHDKLSHYIRHVQDLKYKATAVDSSAFLDSIKILEDGLSTLKNSYENELDKAR